MSQLKFYIDGKSVTPPREWQDIKVLAAFGTNSNQPEVESDRFTLVKDAATAVIDHVNAGDIFMGIDATLEFEQRNNVTTIFKGIIDTNDNYEEINPTFGSEEKPNQISVKFRAINTITTFRELIDGVTCGYLLDIGVIKDSDFTIINTVIVKRSTFMEVAMAVVMGYFLFKQIRDTIKEIANLVAEIVGHSTGGFIGPIAAVIFTAAKIVIQVFYVIALIKLMIDIIAKLKRLLAPPVVKNKGINFRTFAKKICNHYGFNFISPIPEMDSFHYLPSKPFTNEKNVILDNLPLLVPTKYGTPSSSDFGYLLNEFFELCKRLFDAKIDVVGSDVHLRNVNDPFWYNVSTYVPPIDIKFPTKKYNTQDLRNTRMMSFVTDPNDEWTMENYTGTSFEVKTQPVGTYDVKRVIIKGLDRTDIPMALPTRKNELSAVENFVLIFLKAADTLSKLLVKKTTFAADFVRNKTGILKIGQNDYTVAKIVPLVLGNDGAALTGKMPANHREILSARSLMEKYQHGRSFVSGAKLGQEVIYNGVRLPFTLADFLATLNNGKFVLPDGRMAEFKEIPYQFSSDTVECDIVVKEVYTNNLKELVYEP